MTSAIVVLIICVCKSVKALFGKDRSGWFIVWFISKQVLIYLEWGLTSTNSISNLFCAQSGIPLYVHIFARRSKILKWTWLWYSINSNTQMEPFFNRSSRRSSGSTSSNWTDLIDEPTCRANCRLGPETYVSRRPKHLEIRLIRQIKHINTTKNTSKSSWGMIVSTLGHPSVKI